MEEIKPKKERKFLKAMGDIALTLFRELVFGIGKKVINKVGNKRQGLVISFVILASTFAVAQFPNTTNKQRLGFQTTADGLVWRGSISDTASIQPINNQNAWVILDTVNLKMYSFDFTSNVWNLVGGAAGLTMPFDSITFNTAKNGTVGVGEMEYNDTQGSLIQGLKGGNVINVIGQQLHQRVNNRTGATLAKGTAVYLSGSQGNRITVAKALATSDPTSANTFGIVAESIDNNQSGYVITEGLITNINTSALVEDSAVYLSPTVAGGLTSTKPQAPQHTVYIGVCVTSSAGSGELFVSIKNGLEITELHDVRITSPVDRASLYYRSNDGLWRDTTAALLVSDTASMLTPYLRKLDTITLSNRINTKLNISDTASMLLPYLRDADTVTLSNRINLKLNIADTSAFARDNQISGTSGQVAYFNSSSSVISDAGLIYNATNKSLGINTTTTSGANLIIKNSQEPSRATVVTTQTFAADTTNWTRGAGWTFNGTQAVATAATGALTYTPTLTITAGNAYEITYTNGYASGTLTLRLGDANTVLPSAAIDNNKVVLRPTSATGGFRFTTSSFTGTLDNVSVVEISNPASILFAGQDDNSSTLYNTLRMPNSSSLHFGGGAAFSTGTNNVSVGLNTMLLNTTGSNNVGLGSSSLSNNTTGGNNTSIGNGSLLSNTIGSENVALGNNSLYSNINGIRNLSFGDNSMFSNISGGNNVSIGRVSLYSNTVGSNNVALGVAALYSNTVGNNNVALGVGALGNNTTGNGNISIGALNRGLVANITGEFNIGLLGGSINTVGSDNIFLGRDAGRVSRRGSNNISIGLSSLGNTTNADTLTGSNNIAIGTNSQLTTSGAAANNVAIGNTVYLPTNNGSNQGVYQNVLFFTGASGIGTTIAAASKAGIKTNAPNRDLEVAGEVRITDLTTDAPTRLVGADADGDLGQVTLGAGLSLASSSLLADTSFLVTRFDTASMLTPYFKGDTTSLSNRINAKLNISDTLNMLVPYLRKADTTSMLLPYFRDADTTSLNLNSRFATKLNISDTASMLAPYFRDADTTSLNLTSRFAAKLNLSDTASMLTNYLRTGTAASTYLTQSNAASTYLPLTGGTLTGTINRQEGSHDGSASTFYYNILNYFAKRDNIKGNQTAQITFTDRPGTFNFPNNVRTSDIYLMTAKNWNGMSLGQYIDTTLSIVANQDGGRIGISKLNPSYKLDVNGTLGVTGATTLTGGINGNIKTNGAAGATATPDNIWLGNNWSNGTTSDKLKIYLYNGITDKYGFGVGGSGDIQYHSDFFHDFYIANTKKFFISATNTTTDNIFTVNNAAVFNEGAADSDFRVESVGNAHMVFVDASTDRVGIGTNSPTKTLDVNGELKVLSAGTFGGRLNTNWLERTYSNSTATSLTVSVNTTWLKLENNSTITLTLPNAADYPGKELHIKNAGTGAVNSLSSNIEPLNSTTIGTAILASGGGKWATLVSDGTYWVIMAGN